ncbi:MAG: type I restriction enzyme HsdR N-terminal domain-containing protein [Bacteroidota bacterium]|nr:type I restriction enzyme HsdR N-terminal domain-containing protein [Bacteroidota bacterium]
MKLNLPEYQFELKSVTGGQKKLIYDTIRKKFIPLTPEEWVRQHWLHYMIEELKVPAALIAVEAGLKLGRLQKRADVVVYNNKGLPTLLLECKAPSIPISRETFEQAARYRTQLPVTYLCVSNGLQHFCCAFNNDGGYTFLDGVPGYDSW